MRCLKKIIYIFSVLLVYSSCKQTEPSSDDYMAFENVFYIKEFPKSLSLNDAKEVDFGLIGVNRFRIIDSIILLSTTDKDALWKLVSLSDKELIGQFLKKGQGPNDFSFPPNLCYQTTILQKEGQYFTYIYDFYTGKLSKLNLTKALEDKTVGLSVLDIKLPQSLFNFSILNLDNNQFFCREVGQIQQNRYISDNGNRVTNSSLDKLNKSKIKKGENINILSTLVKYNSEKDLLVEVPIGLNYINIYSLQNDSIAKTICVEEEMLSISKVQSTFRWNRMYTFSDVRIFDNFWGVLYINETDKNYQGDRTDFPYILLFDWRGNPLVKLKLTQFATSFDIDFINNKLYTLDNPTDKMYEYGFSKILSLLKK